MVARTSHVARPASRPTRHALETHTPPSAPTRAGAAILGFHLDDERCNTDTRFGNRHTPEPACLALLAAYKHWVANLSRTGPFSSVHPRHSRRCPPLPAKRPKTGEPALPGDRLFIRPPQCARQDPVSGGTARPRPCVRHACERAESSCEQELLITGDYRR